MSTHTPDQLKHLDAAIEALWRLEDLRRRRQLHVDLSLPLITDREVSVAWTAADAIIEKHRIPLHDATMLIRAGLMTLLHGYVAEWAKRTRSEHGFA